MFRKTNSKRSRKVSRKRSRQRSRKRSSQVSNKRSRRISHKIRISRKLRNSRKNKHSDGNIDNSLEERKAEQKKAEQKIEKYAKKNNFQTVIDAVNYIKNNPKKVGFALVAAVIAYNFYNGGESSGKNSSQKFNSNSNINRQHSSNASTIIPFVPFTDPKIKYVPLNGGNNRCYMNASIQFIYSISSIRDFFYKITEEDIISFKMNDKDSNEIIYREIDKKGKTLKEFTRGIIYHRIFKLLSFLFNEIKNNSNNITINLGELRYNNELFYQRIRAICQHINDGNYIDTFRDGAQEDASEFIVKLLEPFSYYKKDIQNKSIDPNNLIEKCYDSFSFNNTDIFNCEDGTIKDKISSESGSRIDLQIVDINKINTKLKKNIVSICIQDLIDYYMEPEILTDSENKLEICGKNQQTGENNICISKKHSYIMNKNDYIIISLKRFEIYFENNSYKTKKIENEIYPSQFINFDNNKFIIVGCILNRGSSVNAGHYVYQVFTDGKPDYIIDDSNVVPTTEYKILEQGYVYLYKRVPDIVDEELYYDAQ